MGLLSTPAPIAASPSQPRNYHWTSEKSREAEQLGLCHQHVKAMHARTPLLRLQLKP